MRFNGYEHPDNFDITNRPTNGSLTRGYIARIILSAIPGAVVLPMPYTFWFSDEPSTNTMLVLALIGAVIGIAIFIPISLRNGKRKRAEFISAGGDPTGIKLHQFASMGGEILPDGRWRWMKETVSTY